MDVKSNNTDTSSLGYYGTQRNGGFTLLFASLAAGLLLVIAMSIATISIKESQLSGLARESQYAFYAADAGVECVLYWDSVFDAFSRDDGTTVPITCVGQNALVGDDVTGISNFELTFPGLPYCVLVQVERRIGPLTTIRSRGRNTCDINAGRRVERAIIVNY